MERLGKPSAFASPMNGRMSETPLLLESHVANLYQSTMLFGIVWVLLLQTFATWVLIPLRQLLLSLR